MSDRSATDPRRPPSSHPRQLRFDLLVLAAVLGLAGFGLGGIALAQPAVRATARPIGYRVSGTFSYSGAVNPDSIYAAPRVVTGQPVFLKLVHALGVSFAFRLTSDQTLVAAGTAQMTARVQNGQGLSRTLQLQRPTAFTGSGGAVRGTLSLHEIAVIAQQYGAAAGGFQQPVTVRLVPVIRVRGSVGGLPLNTVMAPALTLTLNGQVLQPPATGGSRLYRVTSTGIIPRVVDVPSALSFRELSLPLRQAEFIALGLLAAALALAAVSSRSILGALNHRDERVRIEARHGALLVPVLSAPDGRLIELESFDGLVGLAKRFETLILAAEDGSTTSYMVLDSGVVYLYRTRSNPLPQHTASEDDTSAVPARGPSGSLSDHSRLIAAFAGARSQNGSPSSPRGGSSRRPPAERASTRR
ncbi:MAG TPA: hypothetical protein VNN74_06810 [Candidatus Micrarchaeia archaeon]|nr:hypothetical protein [Candidatus Micrarchaeia archaeon]